MRGYLGDSIGTRGVVRARHDRFASVVAHTLDDFGAIRCHHHAISHLHVAHTLPDADHKWGPAEQPKRLAREAGGTETRGNYRQRLHVPKRARNERKGTLLKLYRR
jgi:hypothetical protein